MPSVASRRSVSSITETNRSLSPADAYREINEYAGWRIPPSYRPETSSPIPALRSASRTGAPSASLSK